MPTSPSHRCAMGPSLSPLKGGEGLLRRRLIRKIRGWGEAAEFGGEEAGEFYCRQVVALGADDLDADRQAGGGQAERGGGGRQVRETCRAGPEELLLVGHLLAVDRDQPLASVGI